MNDPRIWETQYQMIMALGQCGCKEALPFLKALTNREFEATMVYLALGDAIVRLARRYDNDAEPVLELLNSENQMLVDGALRAVAMLQLKLNQDAIDTIVQYSLKLMPQDGNRFWIAAAAAGWNGSDVDKFLLECATSGRDDLECAASASLKKKHLKWKPL